MKQEQPYQTKEATIDLEQQTVMGVPPQTQHLAPPVVESSLPEKTWIHNLLIKISDQAVV